MIQEGTRNRCVSATRMNDLSSRSHSVLTFWIHKATFEDGLPTTTVSSQLNLVTCGVAWGVCSRTTVLCMYLVCELCICVR